MLKVYRVGILVISMVLSAKIAQSVTSLYTVSVQEEHFNSNKVPVLKLHRM